MKDKHKKLLKRSLYWFVIIGFVYSISTRLTDLENVVDVLKKGNLALIAAAFVLEILYLYFYSMTYRAAIKLTGAVPSQWDVFVSLLSMFFVNIATPFGGWAGIFFFSKRVSDRCDYPATNIAISTAIGQVVSNSFFLLLIVVSVLFLDFVGMRGMSVIFTATIIYGLMNFTIILVLYLSARKPIFAQKFVFTLKNQIGTIGGLKKKSFLKFADNSVEKLISNVSLTMKIVIQNVKSKGLQESILYSVLSNLTYFSLLYILFIAFNVPVTFLQVFISHSVMYLFLVVSPTPNGIGFVEGIAQLVMSAIGIPKDGAVVVTLAFRGLIVWLPIFIGFFAFRSGKVSLAEYRKTQAAYK